jgi:hypothetical protein
MLGLSSAASADMPKKITWEMLSSLNYQTGDIPESVQELLNTPVQIEGFLVPLLLEDFVETVSEFILVPNPLACIHIPPPPPNQMIYVQSENPVPLDMDMRGISIVGYLTVPNPIVEEGYVSYEMKSFHAERANLEFDFGDHFFD